MIKKIEIPASREMKKGIGPCFINNDIAAVSKDLCQKSAMKRAFASVFIGKPTKKAAK